MWNAALGRGRPSLRSLACCAVAAAGLLGTTGLATAGTPQVGVYTGAGDPAGVAAFGTWLGTSPTVALDYLEWNSWADIDNTVWALDAWQGSPYHLVLSVPMLPADGSTLAQGASGAYDHHFVRLAQHLVAHGLEDATIRLGWEFNHPHFPWYAGSDPASFVSYWRSVVGAMRSASAADFRFEWTVNRGSAFNVEQAYPGDAYVDTIGLDVYNHDWSPGWENPVTRWTNIRDMSYGLRWHRQFAAARGKPTSFPEWGLILRPDGHGGGDDPYFIEQMHAWMRGGNTAFQVYFDVDTLTSTNSITSGVFSQGAARFRALFGPLAPPPPAGPPSPPVAPPTPATPRLAVPSVPPGATRNVVAGFATARDVRAVVRRSKRRVRIAVGVKKADWVRRVDVVVDGRRVCRDGMRPFRCLVRDLSPGRHVLVVRVRARDGKKIVLRRVMTMGGGIRRPFVLRTTG